MVAAKEHILDILNEVTDPEIPVLTIADLGILRGVNVEENGQIEVIITPTYSGCPAMDTISVNVRATLEDHGFINVKVTSVLSPAWTTEWM
ncbi:MAG: iron-sulfur cluster assembly protein, partial [Saprospiraceae bacterium]|nr:iron-sulfur cluster assembly protein [Saprospiraceae bacterium]